MQHLGAAEDPKYVADDIIRSVVDAADRDEAIERLFFALYPGLARTAFGLVGDGDLAEQLALEAFLRLWRRWPWLRDPQAAPAYLRRTVARRARPSIRRLVLDGDLRQTGDTAAAWQSFTRVRDQAGRRRRLQVTGAAVAVAVAAVAVIAVPAVTHRAHHVASRAPITSIHDQHRGLHRVRWSEQGGQIAITARIRQPGAGGGPAGVGTSGPVVSERGQIWGITYVAELASFYSRDHLSYLFKIDGRTDRVVFREPVAGLTGIAAAAGSIWVLIALGSSAGQLLRIDPVTDQVITTFPLSAACGQVLDAGAQLWLVCGGYPLTDTSTFLVRVDPATGHVLASTGSVYTSGQVAATPDGIWYVADSGLFGLIGTGARLRRVRADDSTYPVSFAYTNSLVYADGALWALTDDESVAKIDPVTGKIIRVYGYLNYDPSESLGLDFMTVGLGSFWFLESNARSAVSVLRVNLATGEPQASTFDRYGVCGGLCSQIYSAGGSIWVPTERLIDRIDPVRLGGGRLVVSQLRRRASR